MLVCEILYKKSVELIFVTRSTLRGLRIAYVVRNEQRRSPRRYDRYPISIKSI